MSDSCDKHVSGFKEIWAYIHGATSDGFDQSVLWAYFFIVIFLCGGCGLWETIVTDSLNMEMPNCLMSCNTVALSVASAACVDLLFSKNNRPLQAFGLLVGGILIVVHVLSLLSIKIRILSWVFAIVAWLIAHAVWWIVNAHNPNLLDVNPEDTSGGSASKSPAGVGEYKGLKVD